MSFIVECKEAKGATFEKSDRKKAQSHRKHEVVLFTFKTCLLNKRVEYFKSLLCNKMGKDK